MNAKPFCGYWFIGAANSQERAAYYCSWGLLKTAPSGPSFVFGIISFINHLISVVIRIGFHGWSMVNDKIVKVG